MFQRQGLLTFLCLSVVFNLFIFLPHILKLSYFSTLYSDILTASHPHRKLRRICHKAQTVGAIWEGKKTVPQSNTGELHSHIDNRGPSVFSLNVPPLKLPAERRKISGSQQRGTTLAISAVLRGAQCALWYGKGQCKEQKRREKQYI